MRDDVVDRTLVYSLLLMSLLAVGWLYRLMLLHALG